MAVEKCSTITGIFIGTKYTQSLHSPSTLAALYKYAQSSNNQTIIIDMHLCSWRNAELALSPGDPCPLITDSVGCEGPWVGGSSGAVEEAGPR